jgi:hypothetical protein
VFPQQDAGFRGHVKRTSATHGQPHDIVGYDNIQLTKALGPARSGLTHLTKNDNAQRELAWHSISAIRSGPA